MTPYTSGRCVIHTRVQKLHSSHFGKLLLSPLGGNISRGRNNETNKKAT